MSSSLVDRTYIVNLVRRADKRQHMQSEIEKISRRGLVINAKFFDAIDGMLPTQLSQFDYKPTMWRDPCSGKALTLGEIGCALSHYAIWREIVTDVTSGKLGKNCRVLILEDDIVFLDAFSELAQRLAEIPGEFDMVYIHRQPLAPHTERQLTAHISSCAKSYWTCAYLLTYRGAQKLMASKYLDHLIPVDEFLPIMYGCQVFGYEKYFQQSEKLTVYACRPSLISLVEDAAAASDTFHSASSNSSTTESKVRVLFLTDSVGESVQRFLEYAEIYGLHVETGSPKSACRQLQRIASEVSDPESSLVVVVHIVNAHCATLPLVGPDILLRKYQLLSKGQPGIIISKNHTGKTTHTLLAASADIINKYLLQDANLTLNAAIATAIRMAPEIITYDENIMFANSTIDNINLITTASTIKIRGTTPAFIYGDTPQGEMLVNRVENYTGNNWNKNYKYRANRREFTVWPKVWAVIFPGIAESESIIQKLSYPADKINWNFYCLEKGLKPREPTAHNIKCFDSQEALYAQAITDFLASDAEYFFFITQNSVITNPETLRHMLCLDKSIVVPMMILRAAGSKFASFWGAVDFNKNGYYLRSPDYFDIVNGEQRGCWNVPYVMGTYLIKREVLQQLPNLLTQSKRDLDLRISESFRAADRRMYVTNMESFGYLVDEDEVATELANAVDNINPDSITLTDLPTRRAAWEKKYLHPDFLRYLADFQGIPVTEPCRDAFCFPLFSETFCQELIAKSEGLGEWSAGRDNHIDNRLGNNYYENVPTQDIQLFQLQLHDTWTEITKSYIAPMARRLYSFYKTKKYHMAFVVRYHWQQQRSLTDHHDASSYTVNIALNRGGGVDYDGGGCHFIRQNCSVVNQPVGMCIIHPGRMTHYHRGLETTAGIRYILVSFID